MAKTETVYFVSLQAESMIIPLWKQGKNTLDIARALALPEFEIANRLPRLLEQQRGLAMLSVWDETNVKELKRLWEDGRTCSEIAALLKNGITRNAVIGKVHRLGLNGRAYSQKKQSPEEREASRVRRVTSRRDSRRTASPPQFRSAPPRPEVIDCVIPRNLTLLDLEPDDCRWPYGDGGEASPYFFCGHLKFSGFPYCESHAAASIGPGTSSERVATRVSTELLVRA